MRRFNFLILLLYISLFYSSCHKESGGGNGGTILTPTVTFSLRGRITDEAGKPVVGANIKCNSGNTQTDFAGNFLLENVISPETNAIVTVEKSGYFNGFRTFIPLAANRHQVYIQLIKKDEYKTVDGVAGGTISFSSGIKLEFPTNSFVMLNGDAYSGTVSVYQAYLNPADSSFFSKMPGDLRALDSLKNIGILRSFGMANIELQTPSGQLLQIAQGKKVKLTATIQIFSKALLQTSYRFGIGMIHQVFGIRKALLQGLETLILAMFHILQFGILMFLMGLLTLKRNLLPRQAILLVIELY